MLMLVLGFFFLVLIMAVVVIGAHADAMMILILIFILKIDRDEGNRRDGLAKEVAFFANPQANGVAAIDLGNGHGLTTRLQRNDVTGYEGHGRSPLVWKRDLLRESM